MFQLARLAAPAAAILLFAGVAYAQMSALPQEDQDFARKAASGGHLEVELGRMALGKSGNADVRQFAQHMIDDHSKANLQLSELAQREHLQLPRAAEGKDAETIKNLSGVSGADFDRRYMDTMVDDHRQDIADFQRQASQGQNSQLKTFAQSTLPMLNQHLQLAEQVQRNIGREEAQVPQSRQHRQ
jgi:putative membrane protein